MRQTLAQEYEAKGIEIVRADLVWEGDRILLGESPIRMATAQGILRVGGGLIILHDLDPLGTVCKPGDEILRLKPGVHWLGDFRQEDLPVEDAREL